MTILTNSAGVNLQPVFTEDPVIDETFGYLTTNRTDVYFQLPLIADPEGDDIRTLEVISLEN